MVKIPHVNRVSATKKDAIKDNFEQEFNMNKRLTPLQLAILFTIYNLQNVPLPASKQKKYPEKASLGYCNMLNKTMAKKLKKNITYLNKQLGALRKLGILDVIRHNKVHYKRLQDNSIECLTRPFLETKKPPVYIELKNTTPEKPPKTTPEKPPKTTPVYKGTPPVYKNLNKRIEEEGIKQNILNSSSSSFFNFFLSFFSRECSVYWMQKLDSKIQATDVNIAYIQEAIKKDKHYKSVASSTELEATIYKQFNTIVANAKILQELQASKKDKQSKMYTKYSSDILSYLGKYKEYIGYIGFALESKQAQDISNYAVQLYKKRYKIHTDLTPCRQITVLAYLLGLAKYKELDNVEKDRAIRELSNRMQEASATVPHWQYLKQAQETKLSIVS